MERLSMALIAIALLLAVTTGAAAQQGGATEPTVYEPIEAGATISKGTGFNGSDQVLNRNGNVAAEPFADATSVLALGDGTALVTDGTRGLLLLIVPDGFVPLADGLPGAGGLYQAANGNIFLLTGDGGLWGVDAANGEVSLIGFGVTHVADAQRVVLGDGTAALLVLDGTDLVLIDGETGQVVAALSSGLDDPSALEVTGAGIVLVCESTQIHPLAADGPAPIPLPDAPVDIAIADRGGPNETVYVSFGADGPAPVAVDLLTGALTDATTQQFDDAKVQSQGARPPLFVPAAAVADPSPATAVPPAADVTTTVAATAAPPPAAAAITEPAVSGTGDGGGPALAIIGILAGLAVLALLGRLLRRRPQ